MKKWRILGSDSELYKLQTLSLEKNFKIFFKKQHMVFAKHLKYRRIIENIILFFHFKMHKEIDKTPLVFLQTPWMRFTMERTFFPAWWTDKFCDKAAKTSKKIPMLEQKWQCKKQILIRCHEKLNLSVQKYWKEKMQGLQNIKCIPLGRTSRFHPFILVAEICGVTRFWRSRNTLYVSAKDEQLFLFI